MARPQRNNVDYFPHYISDGKKMFIIESKFGNDGYATWFKILETLAKSDHHWFDLSDKSNLMFLAAKCRISENLLCDIVTSLASLGEVDGQLWEHEQVIWSDKFIDSIEDAYDKRSNNALRKPELLTLLRGLGRCKPSKFPIKGDVKPQSIVKHSKENDSKENKHPLTIWINENAPSVEGMRQPLTDQQAEKLVAELGITTKAHGDKLREVISDMENKPDLLKKYKSANLTIRKWWSNAQKWEGTTVEPEKPVKEDRNNYHGNIRFASPIL